MAPLVIRFTSIEETDCQLMSLLGIARLNQQAISAADGRNWQVGWRLYQLTAECKLGESPTKPRNSRAG